MAEVFGTVASAIGVIGVAAQCADGIRKLREFQKDVQSAPEALGYMADELELLTETIASIEDQVRRASQTISVNITGSLRFCRRSVDSTTVIIRDLNAEIDRRRNAGSLKAAWNKKSLENYMTRIERAKSSLVLAYSTFTRELQQQDFLEVDRRLTQHQHVIVGTSDQLVQLVDQRFDQLITVTQTLSVKKVSSIQQQTDSTGKIMEIESYDANETTVEQCASTTKKVVASPRIRSKKPATRQIAHLHLRLPYWLLSRSLELEIFSSTSNCLTINLRPRRVVPSDCELFQACENCDLELVRELLRQGKASVQDVDPKGRNALHHVNFLREQTWQICLHLMECGVDPHAQDVQGVTPFTYLYHSKDNTTPRSVLTKAFEDQDNEIVLIHSTSGYSLLFVAHEYLEILQPLIQWDELPLTVRVNQAINRLLIDPYALDLWLGGDGFKRVWRECSKEQLEALLNTICLSLGFYFGIRGTYHMSKDQQQIELLQRAIKEHIEVYGDLNPLFDHMLRLFLEGYLRISDRVLEHHHNLKIRTIFLEAFERNGVDLVALVNAAWRNFAMNDEVTTFSTYLGFQEIYIDLRLISLTPEEESTDWVVYVSNPIADATAELCGDFWDAIDHPERRIPGSWNDEDHDNVYDSARMVNCRYEEQYKSQEVRRTFAEYWWQ